MSKQYYILTKFQTGYDIVAFALPTQLRWHNAKFIEYIGKGGINKDGGSSLPQLVAPDAAKKRSYTNANVQAVTKSVKYSVDPSASFRSLFQLRMAMLQGYVP
jgi:hypothetical protein